MDRLRGASFKRVRSKQRAPVDRRHGHSPFHRGTFLSVVRQSVCLVLRNGNSSTILLHRAFHSRCRKLGITTRNSKLRRP